MTLPECPHRGLMFEGGDRDTCERCRAWSYKAALEEIANANCMIGWRDYPGCVEAADAGELPKEPDIDSWCSTCIAQLALNEAQVRHLTTKGESDASA